MAYIDTDVIVHIIEIAEEIRIGQKSRYTSTKHPGTNNLIQGWKWDERVWTTQNEREAISFAPTIWDPNLDSLDDDLFQSGYGDNKDLLLLGLKEVQVSGLSIWAPKINHGYYYIREEEWYLFSDQHRTEDVLLSNVVDGIQYHQLEEIPKPTIPIQIQNYIFDKDINSYIIDTRLRKKLEFTVSGINPEFIVDNSLSPPQLIFSEIVNTVIGNTVSGTTGNTNSDDILNLEIVGYSNGQILQEFFTTYSPIDKLQPVEIWTWKDSSEAIFWTILSGFEDFTEGDNREVYLDYDRGLLKFGDFSEGEGAGSIPVAGSAIGLYYTKGFEVKYEPINSIDYIVAYSNNANINPIFSGTANGFIQATSSLPDPAIIELTSTLIQENPFIISLGNFVGSMFATVKDSLGNTLDGQEVFFEILDPILGTFGGASTSISSITNEEGTAQALYHAPPTVDTLGTIAIDEDITVSGSQTIIEFDGLVNPGTVSGIFLYKVHTSDEVLGIAESALSNYYTDFFTEENIVSGEQATQNYEELFREHYGLDAPITYDADDFSTGKKTIILTTQPAGVMHPHSGIEDSSTFVPLFPSSLEDTGTEDDPVLSVTYDTILPLPGTGDTRSYFGVGDAITRLRAYVIHPRTGNKIYSNTISVKIRIPEAVNGTFFADALSDIPEGLLTRVVNINNLGDANIIATSGIDDSLDQEFLNDKQLGETYLEWFRRTRVGDTRGLTELSVDVPDSTLSGLIEVEPQTPTEEIIIPLGFRLKSGSITIASILDQITYIDPNPTLASGIFNVDY